MGIIPNMGFGLDLGSCWPQRFAGNGYTRKVQWGGDALTFSFTKEYHIPPPHLAIIIFCSSGLPSGNSLTGHLHALERKVYEIHSGFKGETALTPNQIGQIDPNYPSATSPIPGATQRILTLQSGSNK